MKVQGKNASSKKTRALIKRTFAILMREKKEISKITVTELVKRADITRGSFYTHYDDIYDVAEDYQMEAIELLMNDQNIIYEKEDIFHYFEKVFDVLKSNDEIYRMLLTSNDTLFFLSKLNKMSNEKLYNAIKYKEVTNKYLKLDISFFCDGLFNSVIKYFRNQSDYSLDEILDNSKKWYTQIFEKN